jgi:uncharacterized protein YoxC
VSHHLKAILELIYAIVVGYIYNGWPFLLAHLFVAYLVRNSWRQLTLERQALEHWNLPPSLPDEDLASKRKETSDGETKGIAKYEKGPRPLQTIVVLEQFIEESRIMGAKGIFVPMTDFSDRLDSAVEGKIAELHDRTNLFLYIGIAGTMFGVFEFAFRSYNTLIETSLSQSDKLTKLAQYLSGSMSKAFPVGFFGLLFTFIAQILATRPEQRLREQLSEAARKSLATRQRAIHSQTELMQSAARAIETATEPLRDLKQTLADGLQPMIDVFGKRLDRTLELVQSHFNSVERTSSGLQSAVDNLRQAVESIAGATSSLESLIRETPKIIDRLIELEKKHENSLEKVNQLFAEHFQQAARVGQALEGSIAQLSTLSGLILSEASEAMKRVEEAATSGWLLASQNLRQQVETDLAALFGEAKNQMQEVSAVVQGAVVTMNGLAQESRSAVIEIAKIAPEISAGYKVSLEKVGSDSITHWQEMTAKFGAGAEQRYLTYLKKVEDGTVASSNALTNAGQRWDEIARNAPEVLRQPVQAAVEEARRDLVETIRSFDKDLALRIQQFSSELTELHRTTGELVEKVRSINSSLQGWAESAAPLTREIKMASEGIRQQNEVQAELVKNLASTTEKIEKAATRLSIRVVEVSSTPPSNEGLPQNRKRKIWNPRTWWNRSG